MKTEFMPSVINLVRAHDWGLPSGTQWWRNSRHETLSSVTTEVEVMRHPKAFTFEEMIPHRKHLKGAHGKLTS